jgi:malonyl-CoA/methylmalonyl-CoA synthetase
MASTLPRLPVFEAIAKHDPESTVVVHSLSGRRFKYGELLGDVCKTRTKLREAAGKEDLNGDRVAFLVENSYDYVGTCRAIPVPHLLPTPLSRACTDNTPLNSDIASRPSRELDSGPPLPGLSCA